MAEPDQTPKRFDILLVSQNRTFNVVEQGLKALVNYLQASNLIRVSDEAIAKEWTEIYGKPGPTAHEMFVRGAFDSDHPAYIEMCIRSGKRPTKLPFGGATGADGSEEGCLFFIEIRGGLFAELGPKLKNRLKDLLMTRFDYFTRDHVTPAPHAVVPQDEIPEEVKYARKDASSPRVGTAVEEF